MVTKQHSVLIVEHEPDWIDLLRTLLEDQFEVAIAQDYQKALELLISKSPAFHVAIVDMNLNHREQGNIDGLRLIEKMEKDETKTIVITGYPSIPTIQKAAFQLGVVDYREKVPSDGEGFDIEEFKNIILRAAESADAERNKPTYKVDVFVLMPFAKKYDATYALIQAVTNDLNLTCKRSDDIPAPGTIMAQVEKSIEESKVIVADLSSRNLNVYFETGISDAKGKPTILLARNKNDVAKLIEGNRVTLYKDSFEGAERLKSKLKDQIEFILKGVARPPNSYLSKKRETSELCLAIVAGNKVGEDTYKSVIHPVVVKENLECKYVWDYYKTPKARDVPEAIKDSIGSADLIIADLAGRDADVYYMSGFASGIDKYPVVLFDKRDELPFDMKISGQIPYLKDTEDERNDARNELAKSIDNLLHGDKMQKASDPKVKVFLNHATEDKPLVRKLYAELKKHPWIDPWIDEERLLPGQELELEIDRAMKESDAVLVCISNTSVRKTGYVQAEIRKAEEQQKLRPQGVIYMIPILLEPCKDQVPLNLQKLLWVDISNPTNINSIIKSLETLRK